MSSSSSSVVVPTSNDDFSIGDESDGKWETWKIGKGHCRIGRCGRGNCTCLWVLERF